jgi:3-hydroxymyristoyl/3-hydroxydecanoyl-(acyl carrier protein) dehydratase
MIDLPASLVRRTATEAVFALALAPELVAFQGHFPGDPVLPGVVQIDWALRLGEAAFGPLGGFLGLDQVKFLAAIRPGEALEMHLKLDRGRLGFRCQVGPERRASGTVLLQDRP